MAPYGRSIPDPIKVLMWDSCPSVVHMKSCPSGAKEGGQ